MNPPTSTSELATPLASPAFDSARLGSNDRLCGTAVGASGSAAVVQVETTLESAIWARFMGPFMDGRESFTCKVPIPTDASIEQIFGAVPDERIVCEVIGDDHRVSLIETDSFAVLVQCWGHSSSATVRAPSRGQLASAVEAVRAWLPAVKTSETSVAVDFWQCGHSMYTSERRIEAPTWSEIPHHYPGEVRKQLDTIMDLELIDPSGRVVLWHGPPGTGKTSAIRALARAWQERARFQIVLDPEAAFAGSTSLMQMLLASNDDDNDPRWRILVIEDADPIVAAEGRGQALSRLLNVGDGIVGQGLRVMVMMTTNQPPGKLHPALSRPGRCLSEIEFRRFSRREAVASFPDQAERLHASEAREFSLAALMNGTDAPIDGAEGFGQYL